MLIFIQLRNAISLKLTFLDSLLFCILFKCTSMRYIFFFFSLLPFFSNAQIIKNFRFNFITGVKIYDANFFGAVGSDFFKFNRFHPYVLPTLGVEVAYKDFPLSIQVQKNFLNQYENYDAWRTFKLQYEIREYHEETLTEAIWHFKRKKHPMPIRVGAGVSWYRKKNILGRTKTTNITSSIGIPLKWFYIEYRLRHLDINGNNRHNHIMFGLSPLEREAHSISLMIPIGNFPYRKNSDTDRHWAISLKAGIKTFPITHENLFVTKTFNILGFAPQLGVEFYFPKQRFSLAAERDWWANIDRNEYTFFAGRQIITNLMARYYIPTRLDGHFLKLGVGWGLITDAETLELSERQGKAFYTNIKGISASMAYSLTPKTDIELRYIYPYIGEKPNIMRLSLGFWYHINPNSSKKNKEENMNP